MTLENAQLASSLLKERDVFKDLRDKILRLHKEQKFDLITNIAIELADECKKNIEEKISKL